MPAIQNVVLAGVTGNLGPAILNALVIAGFNVTILLRDTSKTTELPAGVKTVTVDYKSSESLNAATKGQDAIVSTLAMEALWAQDALIDAAVANGVQHFVPSEFGCDYDSVGHFPNFQVKVKARTYLEKAAKSSGLSYTYIVNNAFFDWGVQVGFLLSLNKPSVEIFDGGDVPFTATTLADIGKAVAGVLKYPEETRNRTVFISSATVTQNQILKIAEEATGKSWKVQHVSSAEREQEALSELKKESPNMQFATFGLILRAVYGGPQFHNLFSEKEIDNKLLGIEALDEAGVNTVVAAALK